LHGNTFWEFKDALNANRFRRIVKYNNKAHLGDVKISRKTAPRTRFIFILLKAHGFLAQWHQWLRYVRPEPPSIEEQQRDLVRQAQIKKLAAIADQKWAAKPSFLDKPQTSSSPAPALNTGDLASHPTNASSSDNGSKAKAQEKPTKKGEKSIRGKVPTGPGETWQPESWTPEATKR
jgi:NADH dehydrogenase [ubiquinone] 1 alpha subcomplex assembly factor 2